MNIWEDEDYLHTHSDAILWVTDLVIDLKLQLLGKPPSEPITLERLNQWHKLCDDLMKCKTGQRL
jgi:hypothetical protein